MLNVEEKIKSFFAQFLDMEPAQIYSNANLRDDLEMDSTETLELIVALEKEFSIQLKDGEITNRNCIDDVVRAVGGKLA